MAWYTTGSPENPLTDLEKIGQKTKLDNQRLMVRILGGAYTKGNQIGAKKWHKRFLWRGDHKAATLKTGSSFDFPISQN